MRNRVGWTLRQGEIGCSAFLVWHFSGVRAQRRVLFYLRGFRYDIKQICSRSHTYPSFSYVLFTTGNCITARRFLCIYVIPRSGRRARRKLNSHVQRYRNTWITKKKEFGNDDSTRHGIHDCSSRIALELHPTKTPQIFLMPCPMNHIHVHACSHRSSKILRFCVRVCGLGNDTSDSDRIEDGQGKQIRPRAGSVAFRKV
jgi:hypothetical protein